MELVQYSLCLTFFTMTLSIPTFYSYHMDFGIRLSSSRKSTVGIMFRFYSLRISRFLICKQCFCLHVFRLSFLSVIDFVIISIEIAYILGVGLFLGLGPLLIL